MSDTLDSTPHTLLLIGNGAVENGWDTVLQGIGVKLEDHRRSGREGTEYFAPLVFLLRIFHAHVVRGQRVGKTAGPLVQKGIRDKVAQWRRFQTDIAKALREAKESQTIRMRDHESFSLPELIGNASTFVITTNWDRLLNDHPYFSKFPILPIHGDTSDEGSLYLPTEHSLELYHDHMPVSWGGIADLNSRMLDLLTNCERVIIWGLSLSPYDTELATFIAETDQALREAGKPPREFIVIDPCRLAKSRLEFLTQGEIKHIKPGRSCHKDCCQRPGPLARLEHWISDKTGWWKR